MLATSVLTLPFGLASPAGAATSPAPPAPTPLIEIKLPNLIKQPPTAPSHPVKVDVPGVAKVEVGLPDVGALLGGNKAASAAPEPAESSAPTKPTTSAAPAAPRPNAAASVSRAPRATVNAGSALSSSGPVRSSEAAPRTAAPVAAEVPVRNDSQTPKAKQPAAQKARAAADVFRGMLKGNLPVWLLVGIVAACAAGTIMVVRSGRRQDAS